MTKRREKRRLKKVRELKGLLLQRKYHGKQKEFNQKQFETVCVWCFSQTVKLLLKWKRQIADFKLQMYRRHGLKHV